MDMIRKLSVKDFQSIAQQDVALGLRPSEGGLTLVVGPSSTGKSALLRAAKFLAYNGSGVPTKVGAKATNILAHFDSGTVVGLTRGKSLSTYTIGDEKYQKAGVSVPADVQKVLNFYEGVHFSFQFDPPYLLNEAGSTVTRVLGEITNAHVLTSAVREGVKRKNEAASIARIRLSDAAKAHEELTTQFAGLKGRLEALEAAETLLEAARDAENHVSALDKAVATYEDAKERLATVKEHELPVPDIEGLIAEAREGFEFAELMSRAVVKLENLKALHESRKAEAADAEAESQALKQEHDTLLKELGWCPVCGKKQ